MIKLTLSQLNIYGAIVLNCKYYSFCALNSHFFHTPLLFHLKFRVFPLDCRLIMLQAAESQALA